MSKPMTCVPLLGGPRDGHVVQVDVDRTYELNVPVAVPLSGKDWLAADEDLRAMLAPASTYTVHRYYMAQVVCAGDGWVQWVLVHSSYHGPLGGLDTSRIDQATMVRLVMTAWRATWAARAAGQPIQAQP